MKEEQNEFSYEDMDKGSNKSFSDHDNRDRDGSPGDAMTFNMSALVQNPGRGSVGEDGVPKKNIFANKVRKSGGSGSKQNSAEQQNEMVFNRQNSSGEDHEDDDDDEDDELSGSDKEFNIKEEMTFEKICLNMLH